MTLITGKRTTKKCDKCDWSVKRDFWAKILCQIPKYCAKYQKMTNLIFALGEKKIIEDDYYWNENQKPNI